MIMARNEDGTYSQVGFVRDNVGIDTEYIYDKDGDIVFEKGFTRETSGTVPLTINGIGKDLKDWSITGNTVQNGTPTPENPVEVQSVGDYDSETGLYKIPVVTRGKNLISKIIKNSNLNSNGSIFKAEKYNLGVAKVEPNKTYCFYVDDEEVSVYGFFANEPEINSITIDGNRYVTQMNTKISVTVPSNANFIVIRRIRNFDSFQLEEGTTVTPYEPYHEPITTPLYLPTPLYSGEVLRSDGSREVKWKKLVLTGKETISKNTNESTNYLYYMPISTNKKINGYCSHLISRNGAPISVIGFNTNSSFSVIYFNFGADIMNAQPSGNTIAGFKEYLSSQYEAGTPVTVWYQLATPTTETVTVPQIPTLNGTTVIDVDTAVKPTEMYTKYKSSK